MIYLASDHGGYELKNKLVEHLKKNNLDVRDMGPEKHNPEDDYPDYVIPVMRKLQKDLKKGEDSKAIILCRNGVGVNIVANRFKGIRCSLSWSPHHAETSRNDDDSNALALPADFLNETQAEEIVDTWLNTSFSQDQRHKRRIQKIETL